MKYFGLQKLQHWTFYRCKEANWNKRWLVTVSKRLKNFMNYKMKWDKTPPTYLL